MKDHLWVTHAYPLDALCLCCGKTAPRPEIEGVWPEEEECPERGRYPVMTTLTSDDFKTADQLHILQALRVERCQVVGPLGGSDHRKQRINLATARFLVRIGFAAGCGASGFDEKPVETGNYIEITQAGLDYLHERKR